MTPTRLWSTTVVFIVASVATVDAVVVVFVVVVTFTFQQGRRVTTTGRQWNGLKGTGTTTADRQPTGTQQEHHDGMVVTHTSKTAPSIFLLLIDVLFCCLALLPRA